MSRYDDISSLQVKFRWNPNAVRGFVASMTVLSLVVMLSMCVPPPAPDIIHTVDAGDTLIEIRFGDGDGTGANDGNLQKEGRTQKGPSSENPLEDAARVKQSTNGNVDPSDPNSHSRLTPTNEIGRKGKNNDDNDERRIGGTDGTEDGPGLGRIGEGSGKGLGYGIEWGGGGNRWPSQKVLPKKPPGSLDTQVKLRFRVASDGRVTRVWPLQRGGDPSVDAAAIQAMYKWKFNPLTTDVEMEGTITFTFKTS